jgi:YesN/AraC family two-component response regulator
MAEVKRLIYIDDEDTNLILFNYVFKGKFEIITSNSPLEGLEIIKREKIGVIITDYKMPYMSGMELIEQVKLFLPKSVCIILSAFVENEVIIDNTKVFKYILKPYQKNQLLQFIDEAFSLFFNQSTDV